MLKKLFLTLMVLALGLTSAWAADEASTGKVTAINGNTATIEVSGELAAWMKKGGYARTVTEAGKLLLRGAKITNVEGNVLTIQSSMAKDLKVGDSYKLSKGKPSAGC